MREYYAARYYLAGGEMMRFQVVPRRALDGRDGQARQKCAPHIRSCLCDESAASRHRRMAGADTGPCRSTMRQILRRGRDADGRAGGDVLAAWLSWSPPPAARAPEKGPRPLLVYSHRHRAPTFCVTFFWQDAAMAL